MSGNSRLRAARLSRGWTAEDVVCELQLLADRLEDPKPLADRVQVSKWETGARNAGPWYQARLCTVFQATPEQLGFPPGGLARAPQRAQRVRAAGERDRRPRGLAGHPADADRPRSGGPGQRRLLGMAARAANHIAYLAYREGDRTSAFDRYALSEALAQDAADDGELALTRLRKQQLYRTTSPQASAGIVESIVVLMCDDWPSGITAWVWGERARQEASLGHEAVARRFLERALAAAERAPERLNLFAPDKDSRWLARRPAYVALRLGHAQEAVALLERNRAQADERLPRELVWNSVELGEAWALAGDLDSALAYLGDGLDRAVSSEDRHGLRSLRRVRADLNRWAGDLRLRQFDDRLREVAL